MAQTLTRPATAAPPGLPTASHERRGRGGAGKRWLYTLTPAASVVGVIALWKLVVVLAKVPAFLLPPPEAVLVSFVGAALVIAVAVVLGYLVVHLPLLDRALAPFIAASQALPVVAIAPILILWFGTGLLPKVLVCALIVFFPVLVTWVVGLRRINADLIGVAHLAGATRWQMLRYVETPLALPNLLGGVRIAFTLAVTGAVVGEFVSAKVGLGYLLKQAEFLYDTPLKFVALFCLMAIAALGYTAVAFIERTVLTWED